MGNRHLTRRRQILAGEFLKKATNYRSLDKRVKFKGLKSMRIRNRVEYYGYRTKKIDPLVELKSNFIKSSTRKRKLYYAMPN